jgi:hypothetical protein
MNPNVSSREIRKRQERLEKLVETSWGLKKGQSLLEAKGWREVVEDIDGDERKMFVASMLENAREFATDNLSEDSQTINVGSWEKFGFPVISMVAENLVTPELVTVQPLEGPTGNVFFLDYVAGTTKGDVNKGDKLWDSRGGHGPSRDFASEQIQGEVLVSQAGASSTSVFAFSPIRPGSIVFTAGNETYTDDSNGNILASGSLTSGSVNYVTGVVNFNFGSNSAVVNAGSIVSVDYSWNSEGSTNLPQVNFTLTSSIISAQRFALRARWSQEAEQVLKALHGLKVEAQMSAAVASEIQFEIDRHILTQLHNMAGAGVNSWDASLPVGVSWTEHKLSFADAIVELDAFIFRATDRVMANWLVVGVQGMALLKGHPLFEAAPHKNEVDGITFIGTLMGQYKVYADPHADPTEYLLGYKGDNWMRTGFIFAPWLLLYRTPTIMLDDFTNRAAWASQFGKKPVNSRYYAKGNIQNYPVAFAWNVPAGVSA